jgi:hypothetical protein
LALQQARHLEDELNLQVERPWAAERSVLDAVGLRRPRDERRARLRMDRGASAACVLRRQRGSS